tara:strand:- start:288 stop:680 length:393 start_codon:yes stop_codon:yes gene_type:complete
MLQEVNIINAAERAYGSIAGLFVSDEGKKIYEQLTATDISDILFNENGYDRFIEGLSHGKVFEAIVDQYALFFADIVDLERARVNVSENIKVLAPSDSTVDVPLADMRTFIVYTLLMVIRRIIISKQLTD